MIESYASHQENEGLVSGRMKKGTHQPDWKRFGLSSGQQQETEIENTEQDSYENHEDTERNELFSEDQVCCGLKNSC